MARYEDEDDRPRRRLPEDRSSERRRPPDTGPPERRRSGDEEPDERRESLMSRRLRAREAGYIDDFDDYDQPPPYAAPRSGYAPSYGGSGGCAAATLYIVLGFLAVFGALLLGAPRLISSVTGSMPQQIAQIIATPTPTVRDRGGTLQQIRNLNRLETQSLSFERVIEASVERGNPLDLLLRDKLLLIASGTVVAGVDLSKLTERDVTISPDGTQITLRLPPSEIFSASLDTQRTRVYDRQTGILAPQNKDLETQARQQAETEIFNAACEADVMQKAATQAQRSLEQFLTLLDFESVMVTSAAGACVAPATAPLLPTTTP